MKKLFASLLLGAFLLFAVSPSHAAAPDQNRTITVTGRAEMAVMPDTAYITVGMLTVAPTVTAARNENNQTMSRLFTTLTNMGVDKNDIRTANYNVSPQYHYGAKGEEARLTGYRVQNLVTVRVQDLNALGPIIDAAARAGANEIQNVSFAAKNQDQLTDALLAQAAADGRHKAQVIARSLGQTLGDPVSVTIGHTPYAAAGENMRYSSDMAAARTPISGGSIDIAVSMIMIFALTK